MDVKKFMDKDLHFIESTVKELSENTTRWDTDKVFEQSKIMFDHFSRRFALEIPFNGIPRLPCFRNYLVRQYYLAELHLDRPEGI